MDFGGDHTTVRDVLFQLPPLLLLRYGRWSAARTDAREWPLIGACHVMLRLLSGPCRIAQHLRR